MRLGWFLSVFFCSALLLTASARAEYPTFTGHVVDAADILSDETEHRLNEQMAAVTSSYVILMTTASLDGQRIDHYVRQVLSGWKAQHPEIKNAVVFAVSTNPRFLYVSDDRKQVLFPNADVLFNSLRSDLSRRDFDAVFHSAANQIAAAIEKDDARLTASVKQPSEQTHAKEPSMSENRLVLPFKNKTIVVQLDAPIPYLEIIFFMMPFLVMVIVAGRFSKLTVKTVFRGVVALLIGVGALRSGFNFFPVETVLLIGLFFVVSICNALLRRIVSGRLPIFLRLILTAALCYAPFYITHPTELAKQLNLKLSDTFFFCLSGLVAVIILALTIGIFELFLHVRKDKTIKENMAKRMEAFFMMFDAGFKRKIVNEIFVKPSIVSPTYTSPIKRHKTKITPLDSEQPAIVRASDMKMKPSVVFDMVLAFVMTVVLSGFIVRVLVVSNVIPAEDMFSAGVCMTIVIFVGLLILRDYHKPRRSFDHGHSSFYTGEQNCGSSGTFNNQDKF